MMATINNDEDSATMATRVYVNVNEFGDCKCQYNKFLNHGVDIDVDTAAGDNAADDDDDEYLSL